MDKLKLEDSFSNKAFHDAIMQASKTAEQRRAKASSINALNNSANDIQNRGGNNLNTPLRGISMRSNKSANAGKSISQPLALMNNGRSPFHVNKNSVPPAMPPKKRKSKFQPDNSINQSHNQSAMLPPKSNYSKAGSLRSNEMRSSPSVSENDQFKKVNSLRPKNKPLEEAKEENKVEEFVPPALSQASPTPLNAQMKDVSFPPKVPPPPALKSQNQPVEAVEQKPIATAVNNNSGIIGEKPPEPSGEPESFYNVGDSSMANRSARPPRLKVPRPGNKLKPINQIPEDDRASTIVEDENESAVSSMQANPKDHTTRSFGNPTVIRPRSQASNEINNSPSGNTPNLTSSLIDETGLNTLRDSDNSKFSKQKTPSVIAYKMLDDNPEKRLDVSINEKSPAYTPKADSKIEEIPEEIPPEEEEKKEKTPRVEDSPDQGDLVYFQSKDPPPKTITPMGGKGPTLTKTIVKPNLGSNQEEKTLEEKLQEKDLEMIDLDVSEDPKLKEESNDDLPVVLPTIGINKDPKSPPDGPKMSGKLEPEKVEQESKNGDEPPPKQEGEMTEEQKLAAQEEELKRLEAEVAELQKEQVDPPGETTTYTTQTVIVDGKKKRKKRKKRRRKKIGGGEETIANITVEEVDIEDMETPDGKPLNPPQKKKGKKKKAPNTKLNTVVEDSKEHSSIVDANRMDTFNFSEDAEDDKELPKEVDQIRPSGFKNSAKDINQNDKSEDYGDENFEENESKPQVEEREPEKQEEKVEEEILPPPLKPSSGFNPNKLAEAIELKEDPPASPKYEKINHTPLILQSQNTPHINPITTPEPEKIEKSTPDPLTQPRFPQKPTPEPLPMSTLKKVKTTTETPSAPNTQIPSIIGNPDLNQLQGQISLLPLN